MADNMNFDFEAEIDSSNLLSSTGHAVSLWEPGTLSCWQVMLRNLIELVLPWQGHRDTRHNLVADINSYHGPTG